MNRQEKRHVAASEPVPGGRITGCLRGSSSPSFTPSAGGCLAWGDWAVWAELEPPWAVSPAVSAQINRHELHPALPTVNSHRAKSSAGARRPVTPLNGRCFRPAFYIFTYTLARNAAASQQETRATGSPAPKAKKACQGLFSAVSTRGFCRGFTLVKGAFA